MIDINSLFGAIFGVGGAGALTVIVTLIRKWKRGSIDDDESIITRQQREIKRLNERAESAENERDKRGTQLEAETMRRRAANEEAWLYKAHIIRTLGKSEVPVFNGNTEEVEAE